MPFEEVHLRNGESRAATFIGAADLTSTRKMRVRTWLREPNHSWRLPHSWVPEDAAVWRRGDCSLQKPVRGKANGQSISWLDMDIGDCAGVSADVGRGSVSGRWRKESEDG